MNANEAWNVVQRLEGTILQRWTKVGQVGLPFTFKIRNAGRGPAIAFFRDGREIKQAGIERFSVFWDEWCGGKRSADWFTNSGSKKSEAQVARFLIPVFELAERTVGAK